MQTTSHTFVDGKRIGGHVEVRIFLGIDLLAKRRERYGLALAGIPMTAGLLPWFTAPLALAIGAIGAVRVFTAVCIDKRKLECVCVGWDWNVPLKTIFLTENLMRLMRVRIGIRFLAGQTGM
ncbi:hypothetical protein ATO6_12720 [Oceanicola sp. 22II-s10i]|uniref:hypothetical protein n=1 Tax=Oceanicola sp. 22II-s10i TaxID=1317116 RepID=UPI000B638220|nr:hypothetical protein ATO6_12720 [Oceanicola sp. 22II-s10i]